MSNSLSLKVTLQAIDKITAPLRGIARQSQRLSQAYKADMRGYNSTIKKAEESLAGLRETQRKMAQAGKPITRGMIEGEQALVRKINETNAAIERRNLLMDQEMGKIRRRQAAMDRGKEQFKSGAMKVASATAAVYAGAKFMQPGFDFSEKMSKVQALTRLDKNDPMFAKLREQAMELGATTWASATQVADAQSFYAMAGYTPEQIMNALPSTLDLAKAGDVDIGRAADINSNILSAFKLEADQSGRVADVLVSVFTRTNTSIETLGETMKYFGTIAGSVDIPIEEAAALAGILGNVGIQGSMAGTSLKTIVTNLSSPTGGTKKTLEKLNIKTKDKDGNLRVMPEILADIIKTTEKMGTADRMAVFTNIAGKEAAAGFSALIDEKGYDEFLRVVTAAAEAHENGEAAKTAQTMSDNVKGDWTGLMSAIESVQINISELEGGPLRSLLQTITKIVRSVSDWIKENPKLAGWIVKIGAGIAAVTAVMGTLTMAMGIFNMVVLANPIVLIIAAIIAAVVALIYFKDEIIGFFKAFADAPMLYINKAIAWVGNLYKKIKSFLTEIPYIGQLYKIIFALVEKFFLVIQKAVQALFNAVDKLIDMGAKVVDFFKAFADAPMLYINKAIAWVGNLYKKIKSFLTEIPYIGPIFKLAFGIAEIAANILVFAIKQIVNVITFMIDMGAKVVDFFKAFADAPGEYISKAIEWISNLYNKIRDFLTDLPLIGPLFEVMFTVAETQAKLFLLPFKLIWDGLKWIWNNIETVGRVFAGIWDGIKSAMQPVVDLVSWLYEMIVVLIEKFDEFFSFEAPQWMKNAGDFVGERWDFFKDGFGQKWDDVKSFFGGEEEVKVANNNSLLFAGAALTPALPVNNNRNTTNNNEVNVHVTAQTNAPPQAIGAQVARAVSSSLIGDEY